MPVRFDVPTQAVYSQLLDRLRAGAFAPFIAEGGSFITKEVKGRRYWYHAVKEGGRSRHRYLGPDSDEVRGQVDAAKRQQEDYRSGRRRNRELVRMLGEAGYNRPDALTGRLLERLANAGAFRLRAVLVGTHAFRCYDALLGVRLAEQAGVTGDIDIAQFSTVSLAVDDRLERPIDELLGEIDQRFEPVGRLDPRQGHAEWRLPGDEMRVELLSPLVGPDDDALQELPALCGRAKPLRFLDYLIYETETAALLWDAGVLVRIPTPARFACHKLIVSQRRAARGEGSKARKDLAQAQAMLPVLLTDRRGELEDVWEELLKRGPKWRHTALSGLEGLEPGTAQPLRALAADLGWT
ncbi:GSU2403 family nucleotidyltransferase fold protein [Magnetospirillum sp. UT-4]|uniref:nucleotidyltransferase family protein n=1 Tax=Magnetospirillum sp. UT-4 TaxID=2681467 RepID=UPI0013804FB3|nr:GSU2403 family nucleotidyltransferase fold protein [Magnetospirillum sp. UT-4]CAA7612939.1 conserved hypothetical protein [Magnetospirillum sp. UT-4]